ncbi:hypothetical protein [Treponema sp.]|uniref:hypothetical protein n=1 Tax=Treponema sp. TaxID=166 RepID=UPI00298E5ECC|nr:hypothetical protein [Treponema sp.]MCR5612185.1 hypothetical protein [Treponema sp.]
MKKSHCLFSNLKNKFLFALAVIAMAFAFTGCPNPTLIANNEAYTGSINSIEDVKAVWENNDWNYHSEYGISTTEITDAMGCVFRIASNTLVTSSDGYSLIFTQCAKGTEWTPAGNYYAIAVKLNINGSLDIVCPCDYKEKYTSLNALQEVYVSSYNVEANASGITNCTKMEGKTPSSVLKDAPEGTVIATSYLRNFDGNYTLASGATLNIGAKININQDVTHYWNANVVNPTYDNLAKTYSFLLAHSSQKDASGSIDPGITGSEPFINQQGLFWSRMTLTAKTDAQWEIKWSSTWTSSMEDAANLTLDKTDSFTGPECPKITYTYKFYFGNPKLDTDGWYTVDKGSLIYETQFEADLPTEKTWKEIYEEYEIASKTNLPEGKASDYWWYSTNSITGIESSYVYKLTDSYKPSLETYEFYLSTKEKTVTTEIYTKPGKYYNANSGYLEITENTIQWNDDVYTIVENATWSFVSNTTTPLRQAYLLKKSGVKYLCVIQYQMNKRASDNYLKLYVPKEFSEDTCPTDYNYSLVGSATKSLNTQDSLFTYPPVSYPQYYTRSAFWTGMGSDYSTGDETVDNSGYCYFIVNNENSITWVTYPLVEDDEYGEEYRERQEYTLVKQSNGLWILTESVSTADSEDSSTTNLSMMEYCDGLELIFDGNTISVDYKGYLQIKEWYTKVNSEPYTASIL